MRLGRRSVLGMTVGLTALLIAFAAAPAAASRDEHIGLIYSSSQSIGEAQALLEQAGYLQAGSHSRGDLDAATVKALLRFQRYHNLLPTGLVDSETMSLLPSHAHAAARIESAAKDSDGDGVPDAHDKCPGTPHGATVDASGCPRDSDGDGVYDGIDRCPDTPQSAIVDGSGCPIDSDGDGVYDGIDHCPGTPRGARVDSKGCPIDSDGDGVFDGLDRCPDTPRGTKVDAEGCPEAAKAAPLFEGNKTSLVLEGVNFDNNSSKLATPSYDILDRVARSLKDWPNVRVEIGGHTDANGKSAYNLTLSKARAETVRSYLLGRGIDGARLVAKGYGESKPITENKTAAGRAKNRRVELTKID